MVTSFLPARRLAASVIALFMVVAAAPAAAQAPMTIRIGSIDSVERCQYFMESEGQNKTRATPWYFSSTTSWRSYMVKDCVNKFATMRASLEAALAGSGRFQIGNGGYTLNISLSDISEDGTASQTNDWESGLSVGNTGMFVNAMVRLTDRSGKVVYGGVMQKTIETSSSVSTGGFETSSATGGEGLYGILQNEVALAAARLVAFKLDPVRVTGVEDDAIRLNYGAPLLRMGMVLRVEKAMGVGLTLQYRVTTTTADSAIAELDGCDYDTTGIQRGSLVSVIESDDPAVNGRRCKGGRLP